jgi:hypothetical protein
MVRPAEVPLSSGGEHGGSLAAFALHAAPLHERVPDGNGGSSARYSAFKPEHWWESHGGTRTEIQEMEKLLLDFVRQPIS